MDQSPPPAVENRVTVVLPITHRMDIALQYITMSGYHPGTFELGVLDAKELPVVAQLMMGNTAQVSTDKIDGWRYRDVLLFEIPSELSYLSAFAGGHHPLITRRRIKI